MTAMLIFLAIVYGIIAGCVGCFFGFLGLAFGGDRFAWKDAILAALLWPYLFGRLIVEKLWNKITR